MALEELRRNIEHEAKAAASRLDRESEHECNAILEKAKSLASDAKKKAKEDATAEVERKKRDLLMELDMEAGSILSGAREDNIDRHLSQFNSTIERKLYVKEAEIIREALKRFSSLMPLEQAIVKIDRKNVKLVKAYGKLEEAKIRGVLLSSFDHRVAADATIEGLMHSNAGIIRRVLSKEFA